ncbi:MAG: hypothetical protein QOG92_1786, partial [Verrucomicrobiota bacterium]|nr:hypothetical protein [Verrucomicrobiota bacterium]
LGTAEQMPLVGTRYWEAYRHRLPRGIASVSSQESDGESDSLLKLGVHIEETSSLTTGTGNFSCQIRY